jgi:hypothetical protein
MLETDSPSAYVNSIGARRTARSVPVVDCAIVARFAVVSKSASTALVLARRA